MSSKVCFIVKVIDFSYSQKIFMFMEDEETKIEIKDKNEWKDHKLHFNSYSVLFLYHWMLFHLVLFTMPVFLGFPCGSESTRKVGDLGSIPGLGRYLGEGKGYPLQYSGLENSMDCIPWGCKE